MPQNRTTSMDLPPVLSQLLGPMTPPVTQPAASPEMFNPSAGLAGGMGQSQPSFLPSYAMGGMVGGGGMPMDGGGGMPMGGAPMGGAPMGGAGLQMGGAQQPMSPQQVEMQIQEFINNHPEQVAQIQQVVQAGLQAGEFTLQDINTMEQMAMTALQNPELYPNLRQLAIQQGLADEQTLSPQYDEGLVISAIIASRAASQMQEGGMGAPQEAMGMPMDQMQNFAAGGMVGPGDYAAEGGKVEGPGTGTSDSVPIRVSTGEYVIPANVVRMKGKEFFDSMLEKYKDNE